MRIVSPLLKRVVYPSLAKAGILRRAAGRGLAVVTYHGVLPHGYEPVNPALDGNLIHREMLRRQLRLLKAHYHVIDPQDLLLWCTSGRELPPLSVLLTCDDGLRNNLTDMLPILQEEGVRCLFFVTGASAADEPASLWYEELALILYAAPSGHFEISCAGVAMSGELGTGAGRQATWWSAVKRLSQVDAESRRAFLCSAYAQLGVTDGMNSGGDDSPLHSSPRQLRFQLLRRAELMQLDSAGMTIGAHTLSHPMLSQSPPELAHAEIAESRSRLEAALGKPVWAFAYPFGDAESVTPQVLAMPKQAGYEAAFLNIGGGLGRDIPRFAIPRVHVTAAMNLGEFEARVVGFHGSLQRWARRDPRDAALAAQG
jgi:peptidoglycan/xylan/chitin deacetylase (PgdA/CDA1 family)